MDGFFTSLFDFFTFLIDVVGDFAAVAQFALSNIGTIFTSFFSLLVFIRSAFSFLSTFVSFIPTFLLPIISALFIYWLIRFIIKVGD